MCIAGFMEAVGKHQNTPIEIEPIRHMILNSLRVINKRFREKYGQMVVAVDSPNCWRTEEFPYYKAHRKVSRDKSDIDWTTLYKAINTIANEVREHFAYPVISVEYAEADDIIGALVRHVTKVQSHQPILIISGDKDFIQLQYKSMMVEQYDKVRDRMVSHDQPGRYLFEHVLRGDRDDGIPNVLSDDDAIISPDKRQKKMYKTKLEEWWEQGIDKSVVDPEKLARNRQLIDLSQTPAVIVDQTIEQYNLQKMKDGSKVLPYLMNNRLKQLIKHLGDF